MTAYNENSSLSHFLEGTAARQPAPGGGSVTALVGALSAAIGQMVLNYSVGKKGLESHQDAFRTALAELHEARQILLKLVVEDQSAYQALSAAKKLPKDSPQYQAEYLAALRASIRAPETIAATATEILRACDRLVDNVNFYLLSDLAVCAELAMATIRCGIYNIRANRPEITDAADLRRIDEGIESLLSRATALIQRVIPRIWERNAAGK
jgi:formiminotetrahydrofolate cyclodeaminase